MKVILRIAAYLLGALALLVGTHTPAFASNELGLSSDGVHWGNSLPGQLFDPAFRWVPGDSETRTFYVRNQSKDAAVLDVTMITGPAEALIDTGDLKVGVRVDNGAFESATTSGTHVLASQVPVARGQKHRIDVRVDFDPASTNLSETKRLRLRFNVRLTQDASVLPPTNGGGNGNNSGHGGGLLPGTGSVISPGLLVLATLLCSVGLALVGFGRRSRDLDERQNSHA